VLSSGRSTCDPPDHTPVVGAQPSRSRAPRVRIRAGGLPHTRRVERTRQRGQAAVEWVGITVVVLLVLSGAGIWLQGRLAPPPPERPQLRSNIPFDFDPTAPQATPGYLRLLRATGDGLRTGFEIAAETDHAWRRGFGEELLEEWRAFRDDPFGGWNDLGDPLEMTPPGRIIRALRDSRDAWRYFQHLRTLPPREALVVASHDFGRVTARGAVQLVQAYAKTRLERALGGRRPPPRPPEPDGERRP
jgi:hypothetical protein